MAVDKNLFLHNLAIVAILKNEGHYLKEWLDYHILAGVDHFYLYDNESPDNQAAVAAPYVKAGLVDYFRAPGKVMQNLVYNDAVNRFKFQCRYMTFIDGDEFIYPKLTGGGITDIVDKIFSISPHVGELSISWQIFGSNGHEKADYSRGVLERFTRRESNDPDRNDTFGCKCIADPRKIKLMEGPHNTTLLEGFVRVTEDGKLKTCNAWMLKPVYAEKLVVNHYHCKSWEEYATRSGRGDVSIDDKGSKYTREFFDKRDRNDEFDDGILRYRAARAKNFRPPDKSRADERLLNALMINLSPTLIPTTPPKFYAGKMETFLTCRAVAAYLKSRLADDAPAKFFEEAALKAILRSFGGASFADARLFLRELPNLLNLPYPAAKEIHRAALGIIPQMMHAMRMNRMWKDFVELEYLQRLLQTFK